MIQGKLSDTCIIARSSIQELQNIQGQDTIKRQLTSASKIKFQEKKQVQQKQPMDFVNIYIQLPSIKKLTTNDELTKSSYLNAVKKIPLPNKELEEKVLQNMKEKKEHYQFLKEFQQSAPIDINSVIKKSNIKQPQQQQNQDQDQQNRPGSYFYEVNNSNNQNKSNKSGYIQQNVGGLDEEDQMYINNFKEFTGCENEDIALVYIKKYPMDTEKQVTEYYKQIQEDQDLQEKIQKFRAQTGADGTQARQYLSKHPSLVTAIENYQQSKTEVEQKDKIIEFKNITLASEEVSREYILKYKDLILALEKYQSNQKNSKQEKISEMKKDTQLSDQEAQWYIDAAGGDVQAAKKMFNDYK